jgi:hypothetical protein
MMPVMANWLEAGLVTVTEKPVAPQDASQKSWPTGVTVGPAAFCAAMVGLANETKNRNPEIARRERIVPELNLLTYAFESVFKLYFHDSPTEDYI